MGLPTRRIGAGMTAVATFPRQHQVRLIRSMDLGSAITTGLRIRHKIPIQRLRTMANKGSRPTMLGRRPEMWPSLGRQSCST